MSAPKRTYQGNTADEIEVLATGEEVKESEAVSTTRPWEGQENPWSRDDFALKKKRAGFRARFVAHSKVENRKYEGWVVAKGKQYGEEFGEITRPGLILMELPEELGKLRDKHFSELTKQRTTDARQVQLNQKLKAQTALRE